MTLNRNGLLCRYAYFWTKKEECPQPTNVCALFWRLAALTFFVWPSVFTVTAFQYCLAVPAFIFFGRLPVPLWKDRNLKTPRIFRIPQWMPVFIGDRGEKITLATGVWMFVLFLALVLVVLGSFAYFAYLFLYKIVGKRLIAEVAFGSPTASWVSVLTLVALGILFGWLAVRDKVGEKARKWEWWQVLVAYLRGVKDRACPLVQFVDEPDEQRAGNNGQKT